MLAVAGLAGCAPSATIDRAEATEERFEHLREALAAYDSAGFLVGPPEFPVVGRAMVLPGPADSAFIGFAASMPPSALSFARDGDFVVARYQVTLTVRSGADTIRGVDRRETVRVADFAATTSREPRVLFQLFLSAPAGELILDARVRELTSRFEAKRSFTIRTSATLAPPLVARRAEPRASFAERPDVLLYARHTPVVTEPEAVVLVEDATGRPETVRLSLAHEGALLWSDSVELVPAEGGPASALAVLPVHLLPPGPAVLRVERARDGTVAAAPLYIGLSPEWALPTWEGATKRLEYALEPDTLEAWRVAAPDARSGLWRRFQERTDPEPETVANEYLVRYFERMTTANDRFDEPGRAGWETDRGEVLVKLGEPDDERFIRPERRGEVPRIEWEYEESLPTPALIVFEDNSDFGVFMITPRSRLTLRRVAATLTERERSREEVP